MRRILLAGIACMLIVTVSRAGGLRLNLSASMPIGLWLVRPPAGIHRGDIVIACPPHSPALAEAAERGWIGPGTCPTGLEPVLKTVVAVAGDDVSTGPGGITVNGFPIVNSAPLTKDWQGRALTTVPAGTYGVEDGTVWLVNSYNPRSFDSRYFGPVPLSAIQGRAVALVTR